MCMKYYEIFSVYEIFKRNWQKNIFLHISEYKAYFQLKPCNHLIILKCWKVYHKIVMNDFSDLTNIHLFENST